MVSRGVLVVLVVFLVYGMIHGGPLTGDKHCDDLFNNRVKRKYNVCKNNMPPP